jgi:hypothetical protein
LLREFYIYPTGIALQFHFMLCFYTPLESLSAAAGQPFPGQFLCRCFSWFPHNTLACNLLLNRLKAFSVDNLWISPLPYVP